MTIVLPVRSRRVRRQRSAAAADGAAPPTDARVPRVARMLALAHHWRGLIRTGVIRDQAEVAALVGVSRARISQVMALTYLAPDIQEDVLDLTPATEGRDPIHHRDLTRIAAEPAWDAQRLLWRDARSA